MPKLTRRDAVLTSLVAAGALPVLGSASASAGSVPTTSTSAGRASHKFEMNIEDTRITLVGNQTFHTFAFAVNRPGFPGGIFN